MSRAASTPFDRVMSASTALVVSAIAGVVLGMALIKMPSPAAADFQGQPAPPAQTTAYPAAPVPVTHSSNTRPSRPSSSQPSTTTTTTTTTTPSTTTTTIRPTKTTKPPRPTTTTPGSSTTTTTDGGLLGPILPIGG